jgi:ubiquinol-cytochrome c reductase cytochrome b subunit
VRGTLAQRGGGRGVIRKGLDAVDERLGTNRFVRAAVNKVFPDHWSFLFGEIALYSFITLVLTGTYLAFFFSPSSRDVVYDGSYAPLRGVHMTEAYRSTVRLSFDVRAGLVFRQMHHWAALVFLGAIVLHLARVFFTGAFRKPREINWIIGVSMLILAMVNGFFGYSLPDDLLSGTGLRIMYSVALAVPVVGTWFAFLLFGGEFPAGDITSRLFVLHILIVPVLLGVLMGLHLAVVWRQKHTQFAGPGHTETNVVGSPLWPTYAARSIGLFCGLFGVVALLGGVAQINPIWLYGPFEPSSVTTAAQPDWYMGWLEGALRLGPAWRPTVAGYPISELFWPAVLLPGLTFLLLYAWPFMEAALTRDHAFHQLLDRPRDRPLRTAVGAGVVAFYLVLFVAGSQDLIAQYGGLSVPTVTLWLRVLLVVLPVAVAAATGRICHDLRAADRLHDLQAEARAELSSAPPPEGPQAGVETSGSESRPSLLAQLRAVAVVVIVWIVARRRRT